MIENMEQKEIREKECQDLALIVARAQYHITSDAINWLAENTHRLKERNAADLIKIQGRLYQAKFHMDLAWKIREGKEEYIDTIPGYVNLDDLMQHLTGTEKVFIKNLADDLKEQADEYKGKGKTLLPKILYSVKDSLYEAINKM
jgi:hypothetical protein